MAIKKDKNKYTLSINYAHVVQSALIDSIKYLNPLMMLRNPTMFIVEICFFLMITLTINPSLFGPSLLSKQNNLFITIILLLTILFSNFAEMIAKHLARAQAESLTIIHGDIEVKRVLPNETIEYVFSSQLEKGDIIRVKEGDLIPVDGEVVKGIASVDESAITGESSPVLKEPGTDISSSVTSGTRVLTDWLLVKVTSEIGQTYLDQMVNIAEDAERHKTPNEISLNALLTATTLSFLLVAVSLAVILNYLYVKVEISFLIALLVCLLPTTISSLITPIRISGLDRVNKLNVLVMSEKLLENAGDMDLLFLDKTGTITFGNRMASEIVPFGTNSILDVAKTAYLASYFDQTPEGKSILSLARRYGAEVDISQTNGTPHDFTAHTRMSGIDLSNGDILRKGACDSIKKFALSRGGKVWPNTDQVIENVAIQGGTPLLILKNNEIIGLISLKDMIKITIKDKFKETNLLGIKTIMCTGDNALTAKVIAKEAGIDECMAQAKPEEKIHLIRDYQSKGMTVGMIGDGTNDAPALAQANIGLSMNAGTVAAKEASNMIDLDSDPTKIIEIIKIGRQLLATKGALTTFSITNDISKYFAILPSLFTISGLEVLNIMHLHSELSAIISALIFNTIIIPLMIPIALRGIQVRAVEPHKMLQHNLLLFGVGGLVIPFIGIKIIDLLVGRFI
ncbi:MAG: potassium-transporting ATPase subunit KdpB [Candidatus Melainabacteria bacterium]|nr:potassium-transporting ATPase subunit KdpB [Candidatus Melainabacteria bacterium]